MHYTPYVCKHLAWVVAHRLNMKEQPLVYVCVYVCVRVWQDGPILPGACGEARRVENICDENHYGRLVSVPLAPRVVYVGTCVWLYLALDIKQTLEKTAVAQREARRGKRTDNWSEYSEGAVSWERNHINKKETDKKDRQHKVKEKQAEVDK